MLEHKEFVEKRHERVLKAIEDLLDKESKSREERCIQSKNKMRRAESLKRQRITEVRRRSTEQLR